MTMGHLRTYIPVYLWKDKDIILQNIYICVWLVQSQQPIYANTCYVWVGQCDQWCSIYQTGQRWSGILLGHLDINSLAYQIGKCQSVWKNLLSSVATCHKTEFSVPTQHLYIVVGMQSCLWKSTRKIHHCIATVNKYYLRHSFLYFNRILACCSLRIYSSCLTKYYSLNNMPGFFNR